MDLELCKPQHFCDQVDTVRWEIAPSQYSISNWMTDLRLECASENFLALFAGCYFAGYVVSMVTC